MRYNVLIVTHDASFISTQTDAVHPCELRMNAEAILNAPRLGSSRPVRVFTSPASTGDAALVEFEVRWTRSRLPQARLVRREE